MKLHKIFLFVTLVTLFYSCIDPQQKSEISFIQVNKYDLAGENKTLFPIKSNIPLYGTDPSKQIFFQDINSKEVLMVNINKQTISTTINKNNDNSIWFINMFFSSQDSIFYLDHNTNKLTLRNKVGKILMEYKIDQEFTPILFFDNRSNVNGEQFLLANPSKNIGFGKKEDRLNYYKDVNPVLLISIKDTAIYCNAIGKFPDEYINTGNSYNEPNATSCFGNNNNICISFGADNNLYLYDHSNLILSKKVKSKFIEKFNPYPDEKQFDMLYLKDYVREEPKYINIVFDPWENLYYRIAKHRNIQKSKNNNVENNWSVIVLDEKLNIIGEKIFRYKYDPRVFIPTPFGILLVSGNNPLASKTVFTLMKIKINE
ncbi:MAG: hypothetical protein B6D64_00890 [Bacteroidetes bacterium 4484_276]|nr:MAG: hypothetical protein B6D64_00890 [Bacteroidetes bacterium 4484_276]